MTLKLDVFITDTIKQWISHKFLSLNMKIGYYCLAYECMKTKGHKIKVILWSLLKVSESL